MTIIRRASPNEVGSVIEVWLAANPRTRLAHHPENLRRWALDHDADVFVVDEGGAIVAVVFSLPGRMEDGRGAVIPGLRHLTGLAVQPDRQGVGHGTQLVEYALADARRAGCSRLTVWTHPTNEKALRLFEGHGFRQTGRVMADEAGETMIQLEFSERSTDENTEVTPSTLPVAE